MAFGSGRDQDYDPKNPFGRGEVQVKVQKSHTPKKKSYYAEKQAARRAAREAAAWRDTEDRNDDPAYHRSFDDGSMHLESSTFRDGKPVDNHGKEVGAYGQGPRRYKRWDKASREGETTTFVPLGETNDTLRYYAATEMKVHERDWSGLPGAPPWDPTGFRNVPYGLRGLRIRSNEPWIDQVSQNPELDFATAGLNRLDDGQRDTPAELFNRRKEEDEIIADYRGLIPWHQSPHLWIFPNQTGHYRKGGYGYESYAVQGPHGEVRDYAYDEYLLSA